MPIGDEVVVYRVAGAASLVLSNTAALLWQCLDGASPLSEIFDDFAEVFRADWADIERDCLPALTLWLVKDLIEEVRRA